MSHADGFTIANLGLGEYLSCVVMQHHIGKSLSQEIMCSQSVHEM